MSAEYERGIYRKYNVERLDGKPLKGGLAFVLEVGDPKAWPALLVWATTVESTNSALAADIRAAVSGQDLADSHVGQPSGSSDGAQ